jgi:phosphotransferase system enzyme I (PtsI)
VEFGTETDAVVRFGGRGIGFFRSEFLWLTATSEPTEAEQYEQYAAAVRAAAPHSVTIRTFDLGADKQTQNQQQIPERNPFLGLRSIRYCLRHPRMFRRQLRAILRASALGKVRIMFPLVTSATELRDARVHLENAMEELRDRNEPFDENVEVGMMVEVPSAAVMASSFAKLVDFFSIGTNDLVQYTLAVDRTNERVADLYTAAHPAVIRLVKDVIRAARRRNIDVSLCGEAAGDPRYTMLLIGLGLRTLSVTPSRIPFLKRVIRGVDIQECERLARTVGSFDSQGQIDNYLLDQTRKRFPELVDGGFVDAGDA